MSGHRPGRFAFDRIRHYVLHCNFTRPVSSLTAGSRCNAPLSIAEQSGHFLVAAEWLKVGLGLEPGQIVKSGVDGGHYSGDLGNDQLGWATVEFQKSVKGTPLEADADKLAKKITEVSTLASQRPPLPKLQAAVKELEGVVAEVKKKL